MAISAKTKLTWDPERMLYYRGGDASRLVDPADVRKWIDKIVAASESRLTDLGEQIRAGHLSLAKWQTLAAREIKSAHTTTFALAYGGADQMDRTARGQLQAVLKFQLEHLRDFALDIPRKVSDRNGTIPPRLGSYGMAASGTYENGVLDRNRAFGLTIARRVTAHGSASCDFCSEQEDIGWQPIDEIPRIGDSPCRARCNCALEFEKLTPGAPDENFDYSQWISE
jgi:hypothetical protein